MISAFQNVIIDSVEGAEVHGIELSFRQTQESAFHFISGSPGKGDDQNGFRLRSALFDQTADPLSDGVGLSGAGARKDEHGPVPVGDGFRLAGVGFRGRAGSFRQRISHSDCPAAVRFRYGSATGILPFQGSP